MTHRVAAWLEHWGPILPLLIAEGTVWLGFGALLPILPIYYTQHGVDMRTLGIVVAAWPAARLVGEPVFGWVADRTSRKRMMVIGLALSAIAAVMPLFLVGPIAFIAARLLAGLFAAVYDPAARGYLVDANTPEQQGETFGLYGSFQMGGFMAGPAVGGLAAAATSEPTVVFWVCGISLVVSAVLVASRLADRPRARRVTPATATAVAEPAVAEPAAIGTVIADARPSRSAGLANRLVLVALILNMGAFLASGTYEVVWSLYMTSLGASVALIGLSFFTFSLPVMLLSPFTGRYVDRRGGFLALVLGIIGVAGCGILYPVIPSVWWVVGLGLAEGTAAAFSSPALYLLVSRASPPGRTSTVQGVFGAAGTIGTITAALVAGMLAAIDLRLPFIASGVATLALLAIGLTLGGRRLWDVLQPSHLAAAVPAVTAGAAGPPA